MMKFVLYVYPRMHNLVTDLYLRLLGDCCEEVLAAPSYGGVANEVSEDATQALMRLHKADKKPDAIVIFDPSRTLENTALIQEMVDHQQWRGEYAKNKITGLVEGLPDALASLKTGGEPGDVVYDIERVHIERTIGPHAEEAIGNIDKRTKEARDAGEAMIYT
ncbi:MAG: hypothetical protein EB060_06675, partial [Proteobacteria bacterium]|nr:hypothetical protein [Pseudomonadota bacterium]